MAMMSRDTGMASRLLSLGFKSAIKNLSNELKILAVHRIGVFKARRYASDSDLMLHCGCGPRPKKGWINIDLKKGADLSLDLREPLPFRTGSCSKIYSEHFLEHLDYREPVTSFLRECHRVLKPGGVLSLAVPDGELILRSYVLGGTDEYYEAQKRWNPGWCMTQMEHINFNFRQNNEHRFCYDFESLYRLLDQTGFVDIRRRQFDPELDSKDRETGSLYVECMTPHRGSG